MSKPYIVFFTELEEGRETLLSVYKIFEKDVDIDSTLIWWEKERKGLPGKDFGLGPIWVNRKPDALVLFKNWWGPENKAGKAATNQKIPVVLFDHGMLLVRVTEEQHAYRDSIYPAIVGCLWSQLHLDLFRRLNENDKFVVTGNPLYDQIIDYTPPEIEVPDEFALLLTGKMQREFLNPSAEELNKIIPVVAKTHPRDEEKNYYMERYLTYNESWTLLPLLYKAKLIITNLSSAWIPALFWQKPIFIHSFDESWFHFSEFKDEYSHIFNFKQDDIWNSEIIDKAIKPDKEHFEIFGHIPDGKNSARVAEVIRSYVR